MVDVWRRGWDSNPRSPKATRALQARLISHSSTSPRRGWDLNPRLLSEHRFSRAAPSTTRSPLLGQTIIPCGASSTMCSVGILLTANWHFAPFGSGHSEGSKRPENRTQDTARKESGTDSSVPGVRMTESKVARRSLSRLPQNVV